MKDSKKADARHHHALGNALVDEGKTDRAISAFRRALRIDDSLAEAHNDLGAAYFQKGWYAEAEACFRKAIECDPAHGIAYANLGAALRRLGRLSESRRAYQRALALKIRAVLPPFLRWKVQAPSSPQAVPRASASKAEQSRISELLGVGRAMEALPLARALAESCPDDPDARYVYAIALHDTSAPARGLQEIGAALALKEARAEYHVLAARLHSNLGKPEMALENVSRALQLEPGSAAVYATLAAVFHPWREDLAIDAARRAIELDPQMHAAHGNLAAALWGDSRLEEAVSANEEALRLAPRNVNYRMNHALILKDLDRIAEARALYRELLADSASVPKVCTDLGTIAVEVDGDFAEGRRLYRRAQALTGQHKPKQFEALLDLLEGKFADGWDKYEVRKTSPDQRSHHAMFGFAEWDGRPPAPGRLLVYGEQGLGDEVMFASLYGELARGVPQITLMCDTRLGGLFARSFPQFEVIGAPRDGWRGRIAGLSGIACQIAAGSLPRFFRKDAADFPAHRGYLAADPQKIASYRERLAALGPGLKIGVSWQGGLQRTGRSRRSLPLERLKSLLELPGTRWVSLQHGNRALTPISEFPGVTDDLDELASLIQALDLVVSVCNTNVHLSGALGKEVLVMAPFVPEWRYGASGERMIWYPSARVFRQAAYGDWDSVIGRVADELRRRL